MTTQDPLAALGQSLGQAGAQVAQGVLQTAQQALPGVAAQAQQALQPAVNQLAQQAGQVGQAAGQGFGQGARQGAFGLDDSTMWMVGAGALALLAGVGAAAYYGGRVGRGVNVLRSRRKPFRFSTPEELLAWVDQQELAGGLKFASLAEMREFEREAARLGFEFRTTTPGGQSS